MLHVRSSLIYFINVIITFIIKVVYLPDPLYCPRKCGRRYNGPKRKNTLSNHLKYECGVPRKFLCSLCKKWFTRKECLKKHCLFIHKRILP